MTANHLQNESNKFAKIVPIYLGIQIVLLVTTYLDYPVYMEAYQLHHYMTVGGWMVVWLLLVTFGLATGLLLLIGKAWKLVISQPERGKMAAGYLLGGITGLLTLGIRFMPIMSSFYFYVVGAVMVIFILVYFVWTRRQTNAADELFP